MAHGGLERDIARGEDVGMAGGEEQIDLRRPGADAMDGGESLHGFGGIEAAKMVEVEPFMRDCVRHGQKRALLRPRQAGLAEDILAGGKHAFSVERIDEAYEPTEDGVGAGTRDLLRDYDGGEAAEARLGEPERHLAGHFAHADEPCVGSAECVQPLIYMFQCFDALHSRVYDLLVLDRVAK